MRLKAVMAAVATSFALGVVQEWMVNRMDNREICGTCKYHHHENVDDGWVCVNSDSDYCTDFTEYTDSCDEWEGR